MTLAQLLEPELADFATRLLGEGYRVFVFRSDVERVANGGREACASSISFSRVVDGRECFASVDNTLSGYQFHMPIKPSREHGSSMFIGGDRAQEFDDLSLPNAELYAFPIGRNALVGTKENYEDPAWRPRLYVEVTS